MSRKLLAGLLSAVLILTSLPVTALPVYASEAVTVEAEASGVEGSEESEDITDYTNAEENTLETDSGEMISTEETDEDGKAEEFEEPQTTERDTVSEETTVVEETTEAMMTESETEETMSESMEGTVDETETETESEIAMETVTEEIHATTITTSDTDIASGTYENITWVVDKNGHLTVEGTGEFAPIEDSLNFKRAPWSGVASEITSAEVNVTGMTDASAMFSGTKLTKLDLSNFDTSSVTNMRSMFSQCSLNLDLDFDDIDTSSVTNMTHMFWFASVNGSLDFSNIDTSSVTDMSDMFLNARVESLDLSDFDTSSVTKMVSMFSGCTVENLKLGDWDTSNITSMVGIFQGCRSLERLDLSNWETDNVESMIAIFLDCNALSDLNVSGWNTSNVETMNTMFRNCNALENLDLSDWTTDKLRMVTAMFENCSALETLDLSNFNTSSVTDMYGMFQGCSALKNLDLSNFDTSSVTDMGSMFNGCSALECLDLSNFDLGSIRESTIVNNRMQTMFNDCTNLHTIYTPRNVSHTVNLPVGTEDVWYQADGSGVTELPKNLDYSILISKNTVPDTKGHITATKKKTSYNCGDTINTDDIKIKCCDSQGVVTEITEGYTTNIAEIDMSTPGKKELIVKYNELSVTIILNVTYILKAEEIEIILPEPVITYNSKEQKPVPQVTLRANGNILTAEEDYTVSYKNNINAGSEAKMVITGQNDYSGTLEKAFTIAPAELTITAKDKICVIGGKLPTNENYEYAVTGLFGTDKLLTEPTFSCSVTDMSVTGTYPIIPSGADAGTNYTISYVNGTLTVQEEMILYTVTFDVKGHGEAPAAVTNVKAGSLITEPDRPTEENYVFAGWFKDSACTKAWDFAVDTVQENVTLYACWLMDPQTDTGLCVQEISDLTYTGSGLKPALRVYASDGVTLLKKGKDYTVKYYNNTAADTEGEQNLGGVNTTGKEGENGFTQNLAYVVITGKGDYTGSVYRNFHIIPANIGEGETAAKGIALKYNDQLVVNTKKAQKVLNSVKYKKNLKAGTDYTVTLTAMNAFDKDGNALAEAVVVGSGNAPTIPAGYKGLFSMKVEGCGNYTGSITKSIYVSDKAHLIKNATIGLGKNIKKVAYRDGDAVTLTPGYYDAKTRKYYEVNADGTLGEQKANGNELFTVKNGKKYLLYGKDYVISYANNTAVGKATLTVTGIGEYSGSKSTNFTITGKTFNAKTVVIEEGFKASLPYTGRPLTQNKVTLKAKTGEPLEYGTHYAISYSNNLKKGKAVMKFTAKPESGYSGSFSVKFNITAPALLDSTDVKAVNLTDSVEGTNGVYMLDADVPYSRNGSVLKDKIQLVSKATGEILKEGTDYTVKYTGNKAVTPENATTEKLPLMTIKGKGNYAGSLQVRFRISDASFADNNDISFTVTEVGFNSKKKDDYKYQPKIKVMDLKKVLNGKKDYSVEYRNCGQTEVKAYLEALEGGTKSTEELEGMKPKTVITAKTGSGYKTDESKTINVPIYLKKLTTATVYVIVSEENTIYTGLQITPEIQVYYGDAKAIKVAKRVKETDESVLTNAEGTYKLKKLTVTEDYTVGYGTNIKAGKNKGTVTVKATGLYGGSITTKFTIKSRNIY